MNPPTNQEKLTKPISIVILPLPAQGHLNQLLHLALHLANRSIPVHYVGSTTHNRQARERSHFPTTSPTSLLHFHDFPLPPFPNPPPNPNSPTHFPTHLQPAFNATILHLSPPLSSLLLSLSSTSYRVILIHDSAMAFACELALPFPNVESYVFHSVSAYTNLFFHLQHTHPSASASARINELTFQDCFSDDFLDFIRGQHGLTVNDHGRLLNTCLAIEGEFVDQLRLVPSWKDQKVFAVGPLNPVIRVEKSSCNPNVKYCVEWLNKQPKKSVLYVSFGTTSSLSKEQTLELADGLRSSQHKYIWVLRDADRGDIYARGEEDRLDQLQGEPTCERGIVVRGWAPQLEILGHESVGGFLTHCGWNSCMESMSMGVPMLTWPMHSDQPRNSVLVTEVLKVGVVGRVWEKRSEVMRAEAIRDSIVKLMVSQEGIEVRKRAETVGEAIRQCGVSREELDSFVSYISR